MLAAILLTPLILLGFWLFTSWLEVLPPELLLLWAILSWMVCMATFAGALLYR